MLFSQLLAPIIVILMIPVAIGDNRSDNNDNISVLPAQRVRFAIALLIVYLKALIKSKIIGGGTVRSGSSLCLWSCAFPWYCNALSHKVDVGERHSLHITKMGFHAFCFLVCCFWRTRSIMRLYGLGLYRIL